MQTSHLITVGPVFRHLPIRDVAPGVRVALFNPLGDWELNEAIGLALAAKIPPRTDALVMPDGKAQALLHVLGRLSGLPTVIARKEHKPYMAEPVHSVRVKSITTAKEQTLFLGADDAEKLRGKRVAFVDDVISTGGSLDATKQLLQEIGAELVAVLAAFTEGLERPDVIALGHLPLF